MAWTNTGGGSHEGADWTISVATTIAGVHTDIGTFTVDSGITATISTGVELEIYATIANVIGTIDGNGKGYPSETGAGAGWANPAINGAGGGGGYGGNGASCTGGTGGGIYDTNSDLVTNMGSGGGTRTAGHAGAGGGSVLLSAGIITIQSTGVIVCNGTPPSYQATWGGGGGSGGSVLLVAGEINHVGTISANGNTGNRGSTYSTYGGGGGGGRIKKFYEYGIIDTGANTVNAGGSSNSPYGGVGTTYSAYRIYDGLGSMVPRVIMF